ncbi:MAG: HU family DNA-binding protein [Candidatus Caccosoma sp.]|nr:HU family DNA-binding protein [Candidatus Caccosoma sp.]
MNKRDLIEKIAVENNITKVKAEAMVNAVFSTIVDELKSGEVVKVPKFGSFVVKTRKQRVAVIPNTEKRVLVPSYRIAGFRPAKNLKDQVK